MLRRIALSAALVVSMTFLAVPAWISVNARDLADPGDADLLALHGAVGSSDAGTTALSLAAEAADAVLDEAANARLSSLDFTDAAEVAWLRDRAGDAEPARDALERAIRAPGWSAPAVDDPDDIVWLDELLAVQRLVKLEARAGLQALHAGEPAGEAVERILLGQRAAHALAEASGLNLVAMMFSASFQTLSLNALGEALEAGVVPEAAARALIVRLESLRIGPEPWQRAWAGEYAFFRRNVTHAVDAEIEALRPDGVPTPGFLPQSYLWQPNRTLAAVAERYRLHQAESALACAEVLAAPTPAAPTRLSLALGPNSIGRVLLDVAEPANERFELRRCHVETRISLLQAALAVRVHHERAGALPGGLAALVPEILPTVPRDAYVGEPVGYDAASGRVFSRGPELTDLARMNLDADQLSLSF